MAWIYSQEVEAQPLPLIPTSTPSPTASQTEPPRPSCLPGWQQVTFPQPRSGMTFKRCEAATYPTQSISSPAGFRARISALQGLDRAWRESAAVYSSRSLGCVANYNRSLCFWKTSQLSLLGGGGKWLEPLPRWGMTVDGALYPVDMGLMASVETVGFVLPRPKARDWKPAGNAAETKRKSPCLPVKCKLLGWVSPGQQLSPKFVESLMGYPIGWTEFASWAMPGFRSRRGRRLKS
jgi:hypothetical protein